MAKYKSDKQKGTEAFLLFCLIIVAPIIIADMCRAAWNKIAFWRPKAP